MTDNISIQKLVKYALDGIRELDDAKLAPIVITLEKLCDDEVYSVDQSTVDEIIKRGDTSATRVFDDAQAESVNLLVRQILEVAKDIDVDNQTACRVVEYIQPLLYQDERFAKIGWDLREYMDWYFKDTSRAEREGYADELTRDWWA